MVRIYAFSGTGIKLSYNCGGNSETARIDRKSDVDSSGDSSLRRQERATREIGKGFREEEKKEEEGGGDARKCKKLVFSARSENTEAGNMRRE